MADRYNKLCPVGRAMNVIGDDWTIMILRDLFNNETCKFQELMDSLEGPSPTTISNRLKWLEEQGIIEKNLYSNHPPRAAYTLTGKGKSLGPIVLEMKKWGENNP